VQKHFIQHTDHQSHALTQTTHIIAAPLGFA